MERSQKIFSLTCEQEESRRLRVNLLLLQEENADLQYELLEREELVDALEYEGEEQNATIEALTHSIGNLKLELKNRLKEAERLKKEVDSLQVLANESAKAVDEKLKLARELSNLRPEIEHLRVQQTTNANALSEKLALQRELQTVQVELENEKRALQKALVRDEERSGREARLESDLESCKSDLAKEKRLREKLEQAEKTAGGQLEVQNATLESRLDDYRAKLKSAKEQIKNARAELDEARKANERLLQEKQRIPAINRGKRGHSQMDADATIGTPDGFPPKRQNRGSTLLGERSEFPITPFLNPSTKLAIETPVAEEPEDNEEPVVEAVKTKVGIPSKAKKAVSMRPPQKAKPKQINSDKLIIQKPLEQVKEVAEDDEEEESDITKKPAETVAVIKGKPLSQVLVQKKKRRLLGAGPSKTLFDDDDENASGKIDSRGGLDDFKFAMPKRVKLVPKGATLLGAKGKSSAMSTFGTFSPLKKDRKRAQ